LLHSSEYLPTEDVLPQAVRNVLAHGWLGVDLFFVLSGFVISYVHQRDFVRLDAPSVTRFLKLRLARVYPAHLIATLVLVPIVLGAAWLGIYRFQGEAAELYSAERLGFSLLLLNGWGLPDSIGWNIPSWSVSSEWFAYLCFPLIALVYNRLPGPRIHLGVILGTFAVTVGLALWMHGGRQYILGESWTLLRVFSEFLIGCSVYNLYQAFVGRQGAVAVFNGFALGSSLAILALTAVGGLGVLQFLIIAAFGGLVFGLSGATGPVARFYSSPTLLYLGRVSYSLYLSHYTVLMVLNQVYGRVIGVGPEPWAHFLGFMGLYLAAAVLTAHLLYSLVEEPARKRLRRVWIDRAAVQTA
jgi:peptidoglycan/LPS O-acetylase OafA/YrhL